MTLDLEMVGQLLAGRYRLEEQIAVGGMGTVWRARDEVLERPVAIKLLHDSLAADEAAAERFRREALTAASISHPNMANVFDYVQEGARPGIVMELIDSETLAHRITRLGRLPVEESIRIADSMLAALAAAHAEGIVHRDVKPANILLTPRGEVKVADFGIARSVGDASLTATGMVMGTAHYSAPEQVRGEPSSPSSDIYATGIVLYEMLTGAKPFAADTPIAVALARLSEDPDPPRTLAPDIPSEVEAVVMRALAREPTDRFASAAEMRAALAGRIPAVADRTTAFPAATSSHETIAYASSVRSSAHRPTSIQEVAEAIPPAWAGRRIAAVLLPLFAVGALVAMLAWLISRPSTVEVPNFRGGTLAEARATAKENGITIETKIVTSSRAKDTVVAQSVAAGTMIPSGEAVLLSISKGPPPCCEVPDLTGKTPQEAKEALERARLELEEVAFVITAEQDHGRVFDQDPAAGKVIQPGTKVEVKVAVAPEQDDDGRRGKGKGRDDD